MLKLVNRTRSQGSRFTFCTDLRDVASRIPLACPPIILSFSLSLSLSLYPPRSSVSRFFAPASSLPRRTLHPRLRGSDNGGLALSSWFIASFDCQVHAGESTRRPSRSLPPLLSLSLFRFLVLPPPTSGVGRAVAFAALRLRFPYGTYLRLSCVLVIVLLRAWTAATRSESSAFSTLPPFFCRSSVPARRS